MRLMRSRSPSWCRTNGMAWVRARDRLGPLLRLPDDADPDLGVPKLAVGLDLRDRGEPDPRIGDLARDDAADLLPQQLIDPIRPLGHVVRLRGRPQGAAGEGAGEHRS